MENRRKFFRVVYPVGSGPIFLFGGNRFNVLDISEQGLKLEPSPNGIFKPGGAVTGSLAFANGETVLVFGTINRVETDTVSIELRKPIPLRIIMAEQRRLIQQFSKRA